MRKFSFAVALAVLFALSVSQVSIASEEHLPFPLNRSVTTDSFSSDSIYLSATCIVNKSDKDSVYSYTITVAYKTDKKRLLSWNFLDWILSQYPNAIETRYAASNLFPLNTGEGQYSFYFESSEAPLWFEKTLIRVFPYEPPNADEMERTKEVAEEYSGVSVSSYDYVASDIGLGVSSCLPENLLVFPNGARGGY